MVRLRTSVYVCVTGYNYSHSIGALCVFYSMGLGGSLYLPCSPTLLPFFLSRFTLSLPLLTFCRYALKTKNVEKRGGLAVIIVDLATSHARPLIMPQFWREWGSCVGGTKAADPYTTDATGAACKTGGGASGWVSFNVESHTVL